MAHLQPYVAAGIAALTGLLVYKKTAKPILDSDVAPKLKDMDSTQKSKLPEDKMDGGLPEQLDEKKTPIDRKDAKDD